MNRFASKGCHVLPPNKCPMLQAVYPGLDRPLSTSEDFPRAVCKLAAGIHRHGMATLLLMMFLSLLHHRHLQIQASHKIAKAVNVILSSVTQ